MEFLFMLGFAIVLGMVYLAVANDLLVQKNDEQRVIALNDLGYMVQDEIITATTVDDGYIRTFIMPQAAGRFLYAVKNQTDTSITLNSGAATITYDLPFHAGSFTKGNNTIRKDSAGVRVNI